MNGLQIFGMIIFILAMVSAIACFAFSIYRSIYLVKDKRQKPNLFEHLKTILIPLCGFIACFTISLPFIFIWNAYPANAVEYVKAIFGGYLFSLSLGVFINSFIVHYYRKNLPPKLDKYLFIGLMVAIPVMLISFFLATDAFIVMGGENFLLPNGINFGAGFVRPDSPLKPNIAFYAICILLGAVFVYFLSDHFMYKEYGKHGTLEVTFLTAFPAGILGARIAYVIGNWTTDHFDERFARGEWWSLFAIWEGGLTILGGAIAGIIVGALVYMKTNKGRPLSRAADLIVPTILLAQAIGRWGNFFNCEVHGIQMAESSWSWLPGIIFNNAHYSSVNGWANPGFIYVPLFFIEFLVNIAGYFAIAYGFGKLLKKFTAPGDLAGGYIIWYGFTRAFMEPLRDASFNMGEKGYWSWLWSLIFIAGGALFIAVNHLLRHYFKAKKGGQLSFSSSTNMKGIIGLAIPSIILVTVGIILMALNETTLFVSLSNFNVGVISLVTGVALLFLLLIIPLEMLFDKKFSKGMKDA